MFNERGGGRAGVVHTLSNRMHRFVEPASPAVGLIIQENIANDDQVAEFVMRKR